jgi:hypothetical protein
MGREANCTCRWSGNTAEVKALLETAELILRGEIRRRIPFRDMQNLCVDDGKLCFTTGNESVALFLGEALATKWAKDISSPPSLAKKLGISEETILHIIGHVQDDTLKAAIAEAGKVAASGCNLIVACVDSPATLHAAVRKSITRLHDGIPIWLVYPKGSGKSLGESMIRSMLLAEGMVDTKVAAVSAPLTAIRFNRRKL